MIKRYEVLDTRRQVVVDGFLPAIPPTLSAIARWARNVTASNPHLQIQGVTHTGQRSIINERGKSNG